MNKHWAEFDLIRAGAALAVIAIHVTAGYMDLGLGYTWNHLVRFAVPLFIIISGFLLYWSDQDIPPAAARVFWRRRLHKILWPYIIWTCIYCLVSFYLLHQRSPGLFLKILLESLLWGSAYYHLYFLIIILQFYLLYPLLRRWINKSARLLLGASLLISGGVQLLLYLYLLGIIPLPGHYSLLYVRAFPVWLFYFVFGMYAAAKAAKTREIRPALGPPLLLWLGCFFLVLADSKLSHIQGSIVRPTVMLYALASYYFFLALARRYRQRLEAAGRWLSEQSFLIYLMHPLVLTILIILVRKLGYPYFWSGNLGLICLYLTVAALSIASAYLISLTPLAGFLGGVRARRS